MKRPVYWFLITSGLAASVSGLAAMQQETLSPTDSYNGAVNGSTPFTPKTPSSADGTNYNCTGNVCISNAGTNGTALTSSCFNTAQALSFQGNGYSLCFDNVNAGSSNPAAINATGASNALTLSGFSLFACTNCPPGATGQGAIKSASTVTFNNDQKVLFQRNCSTQAGGAVNCAGMTLQGASVSASFMNNSSNQNGGAVFSSSATTISGNNVVLFSGNSATSNAASQGQGGAVCVTNTTTATTVTFSGNKQLTFSNNTASNSAEGACGGAIYGDIVSITADGPTLFTNNSVSATAASKTATGGAIGLGGVANSTLSLTANQGDIVFNGNTVTASSTTTRNSIDLNTSGKFATLNAKEGYGVYFYDPIANNGDTNTALTINASGNTGKIVFSGEKLSSTEFATQANRVSYFKQPITLSGGSLVIASGAILEAKQVTTNAGSTLVMDANTTLQTPGTGGTTIAINNLAFNVGSLGTAANTAAPAKISAQTASQTATVSALSLVDSTGNAYEQSVFSTTKSFSNAIQVTTSSSTATVPTAANNPTNYAPPTHYGYQGNWSATWAQGGSAAQQNATLAWTVTGYKENPERTGSLVPNSLWGAFTDIRSLQDVVSISTQGADLCRGFWAAGIGNFLNKSGTETRRKYRHNAAGYAIGAFAQTNCEDTFSAAFCQLFGKDKDYLVSKNNTRVYGGSIYYQHACCWDVWSRFTQCYGIDSPLVVDAQLSYTHTANDMKTNMTATYSPTQTAYPQMKGDWDNDCFAIGLGATTNIDVNTCGCACFDCYSPFVKLQAVYAHQADFQEDVTAQGRSFESTDLVNISMPIGIKFEKFSDSYDASYNLSLTYAPDILRTNPKTTVSLLTGSPVATWSAHGTNLARQAVIVGAGTHISPMPNFEIFSRFGFDLRGSSRNYNVDLGSKVQF